MPPLRLKADFQFCVKGSDSLADLCLRNARPATESDHVIHIAICDSPEFLLGTIGHAAWSLSGTVVVDEQAGKAAKHN